MCEFSEITLCSRPARQGETLVTHHFGMGVIGLASADDLKVAVCVPAGCELEFLSPMEWACGALVYKGGHYLSRVSHDPTEREPYHRDKLVLVDGREVYLNALSSGQRLRVIQLPVQNCGGRGRARLRAGRALAKYSKRGSRQMPAKDPIISAFIARRRRGEPIGRGSPVRVEDYIEGITPVHEQIKGGRQLLCEDQDQADSGFIYRPSD
jgi:hypothetical protein